MYTFRKMKYSVRLRLQPELDFEVNATDLEDVYFDHYDEVKKLLVEGIS